MSTVVGSVQSALRWCCDSFPQKQTWLTWKLLGVTLMIMAYRPASLLARSGRVTELKLYCERRADLSVKGLPSGMEVHPKGKLSETF